MLQQFTTNWSSLLCLEEPYVHLPQYTPSKQPVVNAKGVKNVSNITEMLYGKRRFQMFNKTKHTHEW